MSDLRKVRIVAGSVLVSYDLSAEEAEKLVSDLEYSLDGVLICTDDIQGVKHVIPKRQIQGVIISDPAVGKST